MVFFQLIITRINYSKLKNPTPIPSTRWSSDFIRARLIYKRFIRITITTFIGEGTSFFLLYMSGALSNWMESQVKDIELQRICNLLSVRGMYSQIDLLIEMHKLDINDWKKIRSDTYWKKRIEKMKIR